MKQNWLSKLIRLFCMLFRPFSIRETVMIHSENLRKISPVSSSHRQSRRESIIELLYRKLPAQYFSFLFSTRLVAAFSDCGDSKSLVFPSRSCGLDWDQEGSSDYNLPCPQATCRIRKFANIPHPLLVSCNATSNSWTVSQLVCLTAAAACASLGAIQRKSSTKIEQANYYFIQAQLFFPL